MHAKMAASIAVNQLKLGEIESVRSMPLFVKGFSIAVLDRTRGRGRAVERVT